jgi:hypothetical protein
LLAEVCQYSIYLILFGALLVRTDVIGKSIRCYLFYTDVVCLLHVIGPDTVGGEVVGMLLLIIFLVPLFIALFWTVETKRTPADGGGGGGGVDETKVLSTLTAMP